MPKKIQLLCIQCGDYSFRFNVKMHMYLNFSQRVYIVVILISLHGITECCGYISYHPPRPKWYESRLRSSRTSFRRMDDDVESDEPPVLEARIIGGTPAKYGDIPWQVSVHNRLSQQLCGGTLININELRFVLTAAHCVWIGDINATNPVAPEHFRVNAGNVNHHKVDPKNRHFRVSRVVIHEWFDPRYHLNDIALIFLRTYAHEETGVAPIDLAGADFAPPEFLRLSGYGTRKVGGPLDGLLKVVELPSVDWDVCKRFDPWLTNNHFCVSNTRSANELRGVCTGDSGGPAAGYNFTIQNWYVYGIVSTGYGLPCGSPNAVTTLVRVSRYVDWIRAFALTHILYCGTGNPKTDPFSNYPKCPWPYDQNQH